MQQPFYFADSKTEIQVSTWKLSTFQLSSTTGILLILAADLLDVLGVLHDSKFVEQLMLEYTWLQIVLFHLTV